MSMAPVTATTAPERAARSRANAALAARFSSVTTSSGFAVDAARCGGRSGERLHFRHVAAHHAHRQFVQQFASGVRAQRGSARPHRVEHDGVAQFGRTGTGHVHGLDGARVQRADVEHQPAADGGDVGHVGRLVAHDGTAAARQKRVRTVVHRDVVRDAMHERRRVPHVLKSVLQSEWFHDVVPFDKGRSRRCGP